MKHVVSVIYSRSVSGNDMEVRPASEEDWKAIRRIATNSFEASYSISPQDIQNILDNEFDEASLVGRIRNDRDIVLVAGEDPETEDDVGGFIEYRAGDRSRIRWLHIDPSDRGRGFATSLVETVQREEGPVAARVLETAVEGNEFLHRFGLEHEGDEVVTVGDTAYHASILSKAGTEKDTNEPAVEVPSRLTVDGAELRIDGNEVPGRDAPFFPMRSVENEMIGYFCSSCGSTNIAGGNLERLECENCGNLHRADEWDDAYL